MLSALYAAVARAYQTAALRALGIALRAATTLAGSPAFQHFGQSLGSQHQPNPEDVPLYYSCLQPLTGTKLITPSAEKVAL